VFTVAAGVFTVAATFHFIYGRLESSIKKSQEESLLASIKVLRLIKVLHLLFVDDILIMTKASMAEWQEIKGN
jgi:hypothetical protein